MTADWSWMLLNATPRFASWHRTIKLRMEQISGRTTLSGPSRAL